eukprot:CAMPEP_0174902890 /NCGR_PEP_ID=MMETSP0167-20121228/40663_1 /TAXON_ID=38298 /ORGANISM="Rhodella maculata, Strain CCMP736" /LENGTH=297 /DNA_ID=CAMNT_0016145051 /DNA_START=114 /DNA_END=1003 /DNA_ORIENTATION=-
MAGHELIPGSRVQHAEFFRVPCQAADKVGVVEDLREGLSGVDVHDEDGGGVRGGGDDVVFLRADGHLAARAGEGGLGPEGFCGVAGVVAEDVVHFGGDEDALGALAEGCVVGDGADVEGDGGVPGLLLDVPDAGCAVGGGGEEEVVAPLDGVDGVRVALEVVGVLGGVFEIPDVDVVVDAAGGDELVLGGEGDGGGAAVVAAGEREWVAEVDDADGAVVARGDELALVEAAHVGHADLDLDDILDGAGLAVEAVHAADPVRTREYRGARDEVSSLRRNDGVNVPSDGPLGDEGAHAA